MKTFQEHICSYLKVELYCMKHLEHSIMYVAPGEFFPGTDRQKINCAVEKLTTVKVEANPTQWKFATI